MTPPRWFIHPILIFVLSIAALGLSLFLYIHWYIEASIGLRSLIDRFHLDNRQVLAADTWVVVMVLSILVGVILMGIFIFFIYSQKTIQLYRLQNNFINNFTHELKTPVTSLNLFLQTFMRHELSRSDQLKYIHYMITDVGRLADNIDRILNLAKIESKSYVVEFADVDIMDALEEFLKKSEHLFKNCRIRLHRPAKPLPDFQLNRTLFDMLLMNLMTNAVKYNDSDQPHVDIRLQCLPKKLLLQFADNGIGFERKEIGKIFRKFYQIGRAEDMTARGSGLGLYLVKTIARIHRWKITAQSEGSGKGSVFTLILPAGA